MLKAMSPTKFGFNQEHDWNIKFLYRLLDKGGFKYRIILDGIEVISPPPALKKWVELMTKFGGKGTESGSTENMLLEIVDIPMLAVVRHFNRLGLDTISSCAGHKNENSRRNKYAYIEFKSPTSGLIASELVAGLGYKTNLQNIRTIQIQENHSNLFELGL